MVLPCENLDIPIGHPSAGFLTGHLWRPQISPKLLRLFSHPLERQREQYLVKEEMSRLESFRFFLRVLDKGTRTALDFFCCPVAQILRQDFSHVAFLRVHLYHLQVKL